MEYHPTCINRIRLEFKVGCTNRKEHSPPIVLIESDWNLKVQWQSVSSSYPCINRIRLEFKVNTKVRHLTVNIVLIESDWNLKACEMLPGLWRP